MEGDSPWKVLVRHNIERGYPKEAKSWKYLPLCDLITGKFSVIVQGSMIFRSIWCAWDHVQKFITNKDFYNDNQIHGERSIWWNLSVNNKPLALYQGCSAKSWAKAGITQFADIFEHDVLIPWDDLKNKFNLPQSQKEDL